MAAVASVSPAGSLRNWWQEWAWESSFVTNFGGGAS